MGETTQPGVVERGGDSRSPLRRVALALVVIVVIAIAIVAWPSGGGGGSLNAVAEAAEKTEQEPGSNSVFRGVITGSNGKQFVMRGAMLMDDQGDVSGTTTFPDPKAGHPSIMHMLMIGSTMYMSTPTFGALPGGAKWMSLDLSAAGGAAASPVPTGGDTKEGLDLLKTIDGVEKLGYEDVRGVATTRYRGTTGPADKPMHLEAWIDGEGRIRQMRMVNSATTSGAGASPRIDMTINFLGFAAVPPIEAPDPSEVFDATSLAEG